MARAEIRIDRNRHRVSGYLNGRESILIYRNGVQSSSVLPVNLTDATALAGLYVQALAAYAELMSEVG